MNQQAITNIPETDENTLNMQREDKTNGNDKIEKFSNENTKTQCAQQNRENRRKIKSSQQDDRAVEINQSEKQR